MIKCPNCSHDNDVQKFCGNCGKKLFQDGVELNDLKAENKIKNKKYLIGLVIFLVIWIFGTVIFSIIAGSIGISDKYMGAICFVVGLIIAWEYIRNKSVQKIESENDQSSF